MPTITVWIETEEEEKAFLVEFSMQGPHERTIYGSTPETSQEGFDDREFCQLSYEPEPTLLEEELIYKALESRFSECAELWEDHLTDYAESMKYGI